MSNKYVLNDGFKMEVIKMLDTLPFKELLSVVKARTPEYAGSTADMHTIAAQANMREGYVLAIDHLLNVVLEEGYEQKPDPERILLSPED